MKEIQLTQGQVALVDDEDYQFLNQWKWYALKKRHTFYAARTLYKVRPIIKMHRLILGIVDSNIIIDHRDRNGLNNQRNNLRIVTLSENQMNRISYKGSSKYKGVSWDKHYNKWVASICKNNVAKMLGRFDNEIDAALCYNIAAKELHGEYGILNAI